MICLNISKAADTNDIRPEFCGIELTVPEGCEYTNSKISRGHYFIQWFIDSSEPPMVKEQLPKLFLVELRKMLEKKFGRFKEVPINVVSFGEFLDGIMFKVKNGKDIRYFIFVSGVVKSENVRIYACTLSDPTKKNLPNFISQLIEIQH